MFATPVSFRLTQNPLGADLLPQALIPVGHSPSPEGLSSTLERRMFADLRRFQTAAFFLAEPNARDEPLCLAYYR